MQIKSLKLKNIRSYTDEIVDFPSGTTLLAGNIGVGKSTILLAIEFALFGITKEIPGASLLRNGTDRGTVELNFQVGEKDVTVKRSLKRGNSITQEAGSIIINNAMQEASATELKQSVLTLLNYPQELLTKSKSLVYRYTVYTPQEEMKSILLGSKEDRLNTLRRVFGIDKYKIIKENADLFISKIKTKNRELAIACADVEKQMDEVKSFDEKIKALDVSLQELSPKIVSLKTEVVKNRENLEVFEKKIKEVQESKKSVEVCEAQIVHKLEESTRCKERCTLLEEAIQRVGEELEKEEVKSIDPVLLQQKEVVSNEYELQRRNLANKVQELKTSLKHSEKIIEDIAALDVCPVCKQQVQESHTNAIRNEENKKIALYSAEIVKSMEEEKKKEEFLIGVRKEIEELKSQQQKASLLLIKKEGVEEKKKELLNLQEQLTTIKKEIGSLNTKKVELVASVIDDVSLDQQYAELKKKVELLLHEEKELEIKKATTEKEKEHISSNKNRVQNEIEHKLKIKDKINYFKSLQHWLEKQFINITLTMEKKIMLKVHNDFNALFQKWFEMLVDAELIKVKIDEEFSPVIEQNGHTIEFSFLSGGEKTAAALAYRLALNQVINTIVSTIRTKDVLILDEPTDGFSAEQLDRLRGVLEELDAKQVIIVSHENKIESFVDNVIKLEKSEHTSSVVYN